ncbi:carbohydrate ABC transporter permease [Paenibacillus tarimensis]
MKTLNRKRILSASMIRNLEGSLFIAPWVTGFLIFLAFPLGFSFYMSFHSVTIRPLPEGNKYDPVGLNYYKEILVDSPQLYEQLLPFLRETVLMIPIILIFALMIAILLNQDFTGRFFFRTVFFLPVIFSTGYVVTEFVTQGQGGLGFLERFDVTNNIQQYLGDNLWTTSIIEILNRFVLILWYSGVQIVIFLAGRQTISKSVYESARIDGAGPWEVFWKITLPAMVPFIFLNLIFTVINMFTFPFNPVLSIITYSNYGFNSAFAWVYFAIIISFLAIMLFIFTRITKLSAATR